MARSIEDSYAPEGRDAYDAYELADQIMTMFRTILATDSMASIVYLTVGPDRLHVGRISRIVETLTTAARPGRSTSISSIRTPRDADALARGSADRTHPGGEGGTRHHRPGRRTSLYHAMRCACFRASRSRGCPRSSSAGTRRSKASSAM